MQYNAPVRRSTARVVLLDAEARLLLVQGQDDLVAGIWRLPGGEIEPGQTHAEAAARGVLDETGFNVSRFGLCVWQRRQVFIWQDVVYEAREYFYPARLSEGDGRTAIANGGVAAEARWWTVGEIEQSDDVFVPRQLARLLVPIILGVFPEKPILIEA